MPDRSRPDSVILRTIATKRITHGAMIVTASDGNGLLAAARRSALEMVGGEEIRTPDPLGVNEML